jgi:glycosyltransferase involved in cell wall biosynthesis
MAAMRAARRKPARGKVRAKLVVAGHPNLAPVVRAMRIAAPRLKSIICTHGVEVWEPLTRLRRSALRGANVVLAPSKYTAEHVAAVQRVATEKIRVLPWALDPQFEALAPSAAKMAAPLGFPEGRVVLTVGRWRTDERYKGLVFLVATVRSVGTQFHVTNESTQTWQDITFAIVGSDGSEYDLHIAEILAGQSATVDPSRFTGVQGLPFKPRQVMPRTFIITAEIGEGGPTGVYAVRL